jgi:hypothetical protein
MKKLGLIFILMVVASFDLTSGNYFKNRSLVSNLGYYELTIFKNKKVWELLDSIGYDLVSYSFICDADIKPGISLIYNYDQNYYIRVLIGIRDCDDYNRFYDDINQIKDAVIVDVLYYLEVMDESKYSKSNEVNIVSKQRLESKYYDENERLKPKLGDDRKVKAVKKYEARYISLLKAFEGLEMYEILDKIGNDYYGYFLSRYDEFEDDSAGYYNEIDLRYPYKDSLEISVVLYLENSFIFHDIKDLENAKNIKVFEIRNYLLPVNQRKDFIRIGNYKE